MAVVESRPTEPADIDFVRSTGGRDDGPRYAVRRDGENFDRLQISESGIVVGDGLSAPIAAFGRELGYAERTTAHSAVGAVEDIPSLNISVTVGTRPIYVVVFGATSNSTAGQGALLGFKQDGVQKSLFQAHNPGANVQTLSTIMRRLSLAPGTYVFQAVLGRFTGGTATLQPTAENAAFIAAYEA